MTSLKSSEFLKYYGGKHDNLQQTVSRQKSFWGNCHS